MSSKASYLLNTNTQQTLPAAASEEIDLEFMKMNHLQIHTNYCCLPSRRSQLPSTPTIYSTRLSSAKFIHKPPRLAASRASFTSPNFLVEDEKVAKRMVNNSTLICVPLMGRTVQEMLSLMDKAKRSGADVVEIRLDYLDNFDPLPDLQALIQHSPLPTLVTYRPKWEGGEYEGEENKRLYGLKLAMELGADYIDVELQVAEEFINSISRKPRKSKIIVSSHNYTSTPSVKDLVNLMTTIQDTGADILKIATTAEDISDAQRVFQTMMKSQAPIIGLVMNERGLISQILCPKFVGYLTFATLEEGKVLTHGQLAAENLLHSFNFKRIGSDTKIVGLIGNPVSQSKSPFLFNKLFEKMDFNGVYVPFLVDDIKTFLKTYASSPDFVGSSCTMPFKEKVLNYCDEVDPIAKAIGAANTIIRRPSDGKLIGYNTDYIGAISAIENGLGGSKNINNETVSPLAGKLFIIIGAGGAGKALAYGAKAKGARVVISNRTYYRARELAEKVGGDALTLDQLNNYHPEDGMILANTTPLGMQPNVNETPIAKYTLKNYSLVFDAVYTPKMTKLLLDAEDTGCTIVTGFDMFIGQAQEQYKLFTGSPVPKNHLLEIMSGY